MALRRVFLVAGKRTPFGKFDGALKDVTPVDLTVHAAQGLLKDTGVAPNKIGHIVFGNVVPSTTDTLYAARHIGLKLGVPIEVPAYNVNRLCGSGIQAIVDAKHIIQRGEAECVIASGAESMSLIPHLLYGARFGTRFGSLKSVDMLQESLSDAYCKTPMAITAENLAAKFAVTREESDRFSLSSHTKAARANGEKKLEGEIIPFPLKKGVLAVDEHLRADASIGDMNKLRATFKEGGTVTAATASGIVDGAAAVIIASEEFCQKNNLTPLAEVGAFSVVGVDPTIMGIGPVPAIRQLLERTGKKLTDIDFLEINEAFAAQTLSCIKDLGFPEEKLNVWGGAIAVGHPLGASGIRISLTLARQLQILGGKTGIASACIGGGQGIAVMLNRV